MVRNTIVLAITRVIVYYLILSRIYQTLFSSDRPTYRQDRPSSSFFVMSGNLIDVTRTEPRANVKRVQDARDLLARFSFLNLTILVQMLGGLNE